MTDVTPYELDASERTRLLDEIEEAINRQARQPGDVDREQWAGRGGISVQTARHDLERLVKEGVLETHLVYDAQSRMTKRIWRRKGVGARCSRTSES